VEELHACTQLFGLGRGGGGARQLAGVLDSSKVYLQFLENLQLFDSV
jgi:hypothetical protein